MQIYAYITFSLMLLLSLVLLCALFQWNPYFSNIRYDDSWVIYSLCCFFTVFFYLNFFLRSFTAVCSIRILNIEYSRDDVTSNSDRVQNTRTPMPKPWINYKWLSKFNISIFIFLFYCTLDLHRRVLLLFFFNDCMAIKVPTKNLLGIITLHTMNVALFLFRLAMHFHVFTSTDRADVSHTIKLNANIFLRVFFLSFVHKYCGHILKSASLFSFERCVFLLFSVYPMTTAR